jgi:hypothetical protein
MVSVTWLPVSRDTIAERVACARARAMWKIKNGGFNVRKFNGDHLEHNFGHGKQNLAMVFAMNLLAFAIDTVCDCLKQVWIDARTAKRARKWFFEHIRTKSRPESLWEPMAGGAFRIAGVSTDGRSVAA